MGGAPIYGAPLLIGRRLKPSGESPGIFLPTPPLPVPGRRRRGPSQKAIRDRPGGVVPRSKWGMYCTRGGDAGMFHLVPFLSTGRRGSVTAEEGISLVRVLLLLSLIPALWFGVIPVTRPEVAPIVVLFGAYVIFLAVGSH